MQRDSGSKKISRRQFLLNGAIGISAVNTGNAHLFNTEDIEERKKPKIKYVTLGRTGMKVSNIGYGTSRGNLDPSVLQYAITKGINYFDTSEGYGRGESERMLGKVIKKNRDKVYITTKVGSTAAAGRLTKDSTKEEILDRVMASLRRLDTPYVDSLFIHNAGDPDLGGFDNPNLDAVVNQLKSEGKVRFFGLSCHNYNLIDVVKHAVESNKVDLMILAYSYFQRQGAPKDWLKEYNNAIKLAKSKNIGITTMKCLQGAQAANAVRRGINQIEAKKAAAKWSLNNPNVDVAVLSIGSIKEIDEFVSISDKEMGINDWKILEDLYDNNKETLCRIGCPAPCLRGCLYNVAIPDILRMNMYFADYGWEKQALVEYTRLNEKNNSGICTLCSNDACSKNCLYGLNVKEKLINAHTILSLNYI